MVPDGRIHRSNSAIPRPASAAAGDYDPESPRRDTLTGEVGPAPFVPPTLLPLQNPLYRPSASASGGPSRLPRPPPPSRGGSHAHGDIGTSAPLPPPPLLSTGFSATSLPLPGFMSSNHSQQQLGQSGMLPESHMPYVEREKEIDTTTMTSWNNPSYTASEPPMPWNSIGTREQNDQAATTMPPDFVQLASGHDESSWLTGDNNHQNDAMLEKQGIEEEHQPHRKMPPPASSLDAPFKARYAKGSPLFRKIETESQGQSRDELDTFSWQPEVGSSGQVEGDTRVPSISALQEERTLPSQGEGIFRPEGPEPPPPSGPPVAFATFAKPTVAQSASVGSNGDNHGAPLKFGLHPAQNSEQRAPEGFRPFPSTEASTSGQKIELKKPPKQQSSQKVQKIRRSSSLLGIGRLVKLFWLGFIISAFVNPTWLVGTITATSSFAHVMVASLSSGNHATSTNNLEWMNHLDNVSRSQWRRAQQMMPCEDVVPACRLSKRALHGGMTSAVLVKDAAYHFWSTRLVPVFTYHTIDRLKSDVTWLKDRVSTQENRQALVADVYASVYGAKELGVSFARWFRCLGQHLQQSGVRSYAQFAQPAAGCWQDAMRRYLSSDESENKEDTSGRVKIDFEAIEGLEHEEKVGDVAVELADKVEVNETQATIHNEPSQIVAVELADKVEVNETQATIHNEPSQIVAVELADKVKVNETQATIHNEPSQSFEEELADKVKVNETQATIHDEPSQSFEEELADKVEVNETQGTIHNEPSQIVAEELADKVEVTGTQAVIHNEPSQIVEEELADKVEVNETQAVIHNEPSQIVDEELADKVEVNETQATIHNEPSQIVDEEPADKVEVNGTQAVIHNEPNQIVEEELADKVEVNETQATFHDEPSQIVDEEPADKVEVNETQATIHNEPSQIVEEAGLVTEIDEQQGRGESESVREEEEKEINKIRVEGPAELTEASLGDSPKERADATEFRATELNPLAGLKPKIYEFLESIVAPDSVAQQAANHIRRLRSEAHTLVQLLDFKNVLSSVGTVLPITLVSFALGMAFSWRGGGWSLLRSRGVATESQLEKRTPRTPASFPNTNGKEPYFSARSTHVTEENVLEPEEMVNLYEVEPVVAQPAGRGRESLPRGRRTASRKSGHTDTSLDAQDGKVKGKSTRKAVGSASSSKANRNRSQSRTRKGRGV